MRMFSELIYSSNMIFFFANNQGASKAQWENNRNRQETMKMKIREMGLVIPFIKIITKSK